MRGPAEQVTALQLLRVVGENVWQCPGEAGCGILAQVWHTAMF